MLPRICAPMIKVPYEILIWVIVAYKLPFLQWVEEHWSLCMKFRHTSPFSDSSCKANFLYSEHDNNSYYYLSEERSNSSYIASLTNFLAHDMWLFSCTLAQLWWSWTITVQCTITTRLTKFLHIHLLMKSVYNSNIMQVLSLHSYHILIWSPYSTQQAKDIKIMHASRLLYHSSCGKKIHSLKKFSP